MDYATLIKKLREKMILTQTEFAAVLGVSYTTVCRWETGIHEPTIKQKRKIIELCNEQGVVAEAKN